MGIKEKLHQTFLRLGGIEAARDVPHPMPSEELNRIEEQIGAVIPGAFRDFLLEIGAASFGAVCNIRPTQSLPSHISLFGLSVFFGADCEQSYSLSSQIRSYAGRVPETMIPIADNLFGDRYCLGTKGAHKGKIFFWDHENEYDPEMCHAGQGHSWQNVYLIADSFEDLLNRMEPSSEMPFSRKAR